MMEQIVKKQLLKIGIIAEKSSKVFWWAKTKQQLEKMNADMVFFAEVPSNRHKREAGLMPAKLPLILTIKHDEPIRHGRF